jgi:peptidoglycan/LPS O-acetylase OafA/YrhL
MNAPTRNSDSRLLELDAMRGVAALLVVFFHFSMGRETYPVFRFGVTGVDLFFIISGFVITMSISKVRTGTQFVINRFSRLYPTYWTVVTFTLLALFVFKSIEHDQLMDIDKKQYLANMTMFQHYLGKPDLDGPYWTMIIEMVFYIVMLLLFSLKALKHTIAIFAAITVSGVLLAQFAWEEPYTQQIFHYFPLLGFVPLFLAGIVFFRLYHKELAIWAAYAILGGCFGAQLLLFETAGRSHGSVELWEYTIILTVYFSAFALFVHGKMGFLVNPVTLFLGKISFALYLVHQFISIGAIVPAMLRHGANFYVATFLVALPVVIGLATAITFWVEIPAGKKLKAFLSKRLGDKKTVQPGS